MKKRSKLVSSDELSMAIVRGMQDKKAENITLVNLKNANGAVSDFFVICSGNSDTHLEAIASGVTDEVYKELNEKVWKFEGRTNKEWILLDYSNVVAHIFKKDVRSRFALENLWGDAEIIEFN